MMARSPSSSKSKAGYIDARPSTTDSTNPLATHGRTIHRVNPAHPTTSTTGPVSGLIREYWLLIAVPRPRPSTQSKPLAHASLPAARPVLGVGLSEEQRQVRDQPTPSKL